MVGKHGEKGTFLFRVIAVQKRNTVPFRHSHWQKDAESQRPQYLPFKFPHYIYGPQRRGSSAEVY
jgi:hypothetical protein